MFQVLRGLDATARLHRKVKVTSPPTVIPSGSCVKLDVNNEVVLTGNDASAEDLVFLAFENANVTTSFNSSFSLTGGISMLTLHPAMVCRTDLYKKVDNAQGTADVVANVTVDTTNNKFYARIDGGAVQTVTLTQGVGRTPTNIITNLNHATAGLIGATAEVVVIGDPAENYIKITSDSAGTVEIVHGVNDCYTLLGFAEGINKIGAAICSESGILDLAVTGDYVIGRSLGNVGGGLIELACISKGAVA